MTQSIWPRLEGDRDVAPGILLGALAVQLMLNGMAERGIITMNSTH